jgi:hypothetical protein
MGTGAIDFNMLKVGDKFPRDENSVSGFRDVAHSDPP